MAKGNRRGRSSLAGPSSQPFFPPPVIGESIPLPFGMDGPSGGLGGGGGSSGRGGAIPPGGQILPVADLPGDFDGVPIDGSQYLGMVRREAGETKLPGDAQRSQNKGKKRAAASGSRRDDSIQRHDAMELSYQDDGMDEDQDDDHAWYDEEEEGWESNSSDSSDRAYVAQPLAATALALRKESEAQGDAKLRMPSREWKQEFVRKFANMREAMSNWPIGPISNPNIGKLPPPNSRGGWYKFVHGYAPPSSSLPGAMDGAQSSTTGAQEEGKEGGGSSYVQMGRAKPTNGLRTPSAALMKRLSTDYILALLSHMPYWLPQPLTQASSMPTSSSKATSSNNDSGTHGDGHVSLPPCISPHHSLWLFSLLSALDARLTSEEISQLRTLARSVIACIVLRRTLVAHRTSSAAGVGLGQKEGMEEAKARDGDDQEAERGAWIVITAIAGIWHQSDLWDDARRELRALGF